MAEIIRTSKHSLKDCNTHKMQDLIVFMNDYETALKNYVDYLYNNKISYKKKINKVETEILFSLKDNLLDCPSVLDYKIISFPTSLSARALSSAMTQACGIVKGIANNIKKLQDKLEYLQEKNLPTKFTQELLDRKLNAKEPELKNVKAELSSKCAMFLEKDGLFNGFLKLSALGSCDTLYVPIKFSKHVKGLQNKGFVRMNSFLISSDKIEIRWKKNVENVEEGIILGCDTGVKEIVTFSEDRIVDSDSGYDFLLDKIKRKRKGSKAYKRALIERDNYIRSILNKCVMDGIKQLNVENNSSLKFKKHTSSKLKSHAYGVIKNKLQRICEEAGVRITFTPSAYKSQRCNLCGWVQKSNRKGKILSCKKCQHTCDADYNSSRNQIVILPYVSFEMRELKLNRKGFYWNPDGFFDSSGRSLESLLWSHESRLI